MRNVQFFIRRIVVFLVLLLVHSRHSVLAIDAVDRLTAERLESVHQALIKFQRERREVSRSSEFRDFRANLHVHSALSHDSRGAIEEIIAAAGRCGTSVLMFTEHPASHYDILLDGHKGLREGVLLVPGAETNGMLVFPRKSLKQIEFAKAQDLSDIVRGHDGLTFLSHLEERMDWEIQGLTGVEIYNTHADVKDEKRLNSSMRNPLWLIQVSELIRKYPQEAFSSLLDYPADYLKRWDELCIQIPHTGISANDSHQNIGLTVRLQKDDKVQVEDGLGVKLLTLDATGFSAIQPIPPGTKAGDILFQMRLDPYEASLRHVGTHLLMSDLTEAQVWQSLNSGRAFVAFDWIADATGFDFSARSNGKRYEMGSMITDLEKLTLNVHAPLSAHWKLIQNGQLIAESNGFSWEYAIEQPGVYRMEAWLNVAGEDRIWILSNPVYYRSP